MNNSERKSNPVKVMIINPWKEFCQVVDQTSLPMLSTDWAIKARPSNGMHLKMLREKSRFLFLRKDLTHSHTKTPFEALGKQAFWKQCGKKEKLLVMSNFSFSHSVFYPLK